MQTKIKASIANIAVLLVGIASAVWVGIYLWQQFRSGDGGLVFLLMLVVGPAFLASLMLLWRYRADVRRDPLAPVAVVLAGCILLCFASLPEVFGLFKFGPASLWGALCWGICCVVGGAIWRAGSGYRRLHLALNSIFHAKSTNNGND